MATAIVLFIVIAGSWWFVSAARFGGGGGAAEERVDIQSLEGYSNTVEILDYLPESQATAYSAILQGLCMPPSVSEGGTVVYFIDEVRVTLRWSDEPDTTRVITTWENQPDTFKLGLVDGDGLVSLQEEAANPQGGEGAIELAWGAEGSYVAVAVDWLNAEDYEINDAWVGLPVKAGDIHWDDLVLTSVALVSAGDAVNPRRPLAYADAGNDFTIEITLRGHVFVPTGSPPSTQG